MEVNKIICGDCLEAMKGIPNNSVDLVFTDPPFLVANKNVIKRKQKDVSADYEWDYLQYSEYVDFLVNCFKEGERVLKTNGSLLFWYRRLDTTADIVRRLSLYPKSQITWHKTNPTPQFRKKNYLSSIEYLYWLVKDNKNFVFNFKFQKEMHNFIESSICMGKERTKHPNQKLLKVIKHFLEIHSNKGDVVLDLFIGSGTTAVACKELGRKYIGIEINPEYCEIARNRIKAIPELLF